MNYMNVYIAYEEKIPLIAEVVKAEANIREVYEKVAAYDRELADNMDGTIGVLARAYEAQGFNGGMMAVINITRRSFA